MNRRVRSTLLALILVLAAAPAIAARPGQGRAPSPPVAGEAGSTQPGDGAAAPADIQAAPPVDIQAALGQRLSYWSVVPFAVILLAIAIVPLVHGRWWEQNLNKGVVSLLAALPIVGYLLTNGPLGMEVFVEVLHEYYAFIILLVALYTISGGIHLEGDLRATPVVNTAFLGLGACIASFVGTTGAAMLLIRPLLKTNQERRHTRHIFVFFIFLVANIGGALLPVGDPPLFLGYLFGVPFFWTLEALWPAWLTAVALVLGVFYVADTYAYSREAQADVRRDQRFQTTLRVRGRVNFALILGVLVAVVFLKPYQLAGGGAIDLAWMQQPVMLLLALVSYALDHTRKERRRREGHQHVVTPRDHNRFTFGPMIEVAVLFIGIFITMIPAICLLRAHGAEIGVTRPWQFFWLSGGLSSFLDNAPTYATYFALGQSVTEALHTADPALALVATRTGPIAWHLLAALSLGAVFMGANTYIGNAPNFMVKSICEEAGVRMPSFFGYMAYSAAVLIPTFVVVTAVYL
jgi:Na+/H+ antiporter NhaD/arsenite permease-like protein